MRKIIERAEGVFQPEDVAVLVAAFESCWERFQKSGVSFGSDSAMQKAREQLGKGIIEAAKHGERDPHRLCEDALLHMTQDGSARRVLK
jgi:hypothetical protein